MARKTLERSRQNENCLNRIADIVLTLERDGMEIVRITEILGKAGFYSTTASIKSPAVIGVRNIGDNDDDWIELSAANESEAAEMWAERYDSKSGENAIVREAKEVTVPVRRPGEHKIKQFIVSGITVDHYWAEPDFFDTHVFIIYSAPLIARETTTPARPDSSSIFKSRRYIL